MLAELLGSDTSLLSPHYTSTGGAKSKEAARRKTEELKKWRKENRSRVKEKYNEELARKRKPEAHPFSTDKALVSQPSNSCYCPIIVNVFRNRYNFHINTRLIALKRHVGRASQFRLPSTVYDFFSSLPHMFKLHFMLGHTWGIVETR